MPVRAIDAHGTAAQLIFGQADGRFMIRALQTPVQNKRLLLMTNDAARLQTAERPAMTERVDRFQHAGFAATVRANQEVKAGR